MEDFMATQNEEKCKEAYNNYLNILYHDKEILWEDQSKINKDPPDFYLYIGDDKYAVEVTETKILKKAILDNGEVIQKTYIHSCLRLAENISSIAEKKGILKGIFAIDFYAPLSSNSFNKISDIVKSHVINYIVKTTNKLSFAKENISIDNKKVCSIKKISSESNILAPNFIGNSAWTHSPENVSFVSNMIKNAVDEKKYKLEKGGVLAPKILIIYDSYHLADEETYRMSFTNTNIENLDYYHSVFIVINGEQCLPYYQR